MQFQYKLPIGKEDDFKGMVDLIEMHAIISIRWLRKRYREWRNSSRY